MNIHDLFSTITERLSAGANVKNVYGEPVAVAGRTVIPIARVRYAFGGGAGGPRRGQEAGDGGGGGGGRLSATPCGALEITPQGTRFVTLHHQRIIVAALAAGFALGALAVLTTSTPVSKR